MSLGALSSLGGFLGGGGQQNTSTNTLSLGANVSPVISLNLSGQSGFGGDSAAGSDAQSSVIPTIDNTPQSPAGIGGVIGGLLGPSPSVDAGTAGTILPSGFAPPSGGFGGGSDLLVPALTLAVAAGATWFFFFR